MDIVIAGGGPGGLYCALLMKKAIPAARVRLYERNRADDTFGFGVVFSDETLGNFLDRDPESHAAITNVFAYWDEIDMHWNGRIVRTGGHGFCGCGRVELLRILQRRCREVGVELHFETEAPHPSTLEGVDLVVGADGINSGIREAYKDHFRPSFDLRRNHFVWMGSDKPCPAFTFQWVEDRHGIWVLGEYQYSNRMATWIVEAPEETWESARHEVAHLDGDRLVAWMETLWKDYLDGHRLYANRSIWRRFPVIRCERWYRGNIVLIGDALHTAHYSIGSGTKLAMEDAIALTDALVETGTVADALPRFEEMRRAEVGATQHAGDVSVVWTEDPRRYVGFTPLQATYSMLTRAKAVTHENLRLRDARFVSEVENWFAAEAGHAGSGTRAAAPPPMFVPFQLRGMSLENRVVVSPMDMYSAEDGTIGDFHFVHIGALAHGGAGLIFSEMACVSRDGRITPGCGGLYKAEHVAAWKRIADYVHGSSDAKFAIQIGHCGRKGSTRVAWDGMDLPLPEGNWEVVGPSPLAHAEHMHVPREMTRADMDAVTAQFESAARMAFDAGADMLELHMAHGYLLSSFLTPLANRRDDAFGGSLANRMRWPLEVFDAVRAVWPEARPLSVRISATDWVGDSGITPADAVEMARALRGHGCDIIDVSAGQTTPDARPVYGRMFQTPFSDRIRNEARIPTMAVGNITTWDQVNTILAAGRADLVCLARPHLTNPHFTLQAAAWYGHEGQRWPKQYEAAREQAMRLGARDRDEWKTLRQAAAPRPHSVLPGGAADGAPRRDAG